MTTNWGCWRVVIFMCGVCLGCMLAIFLYNLQMQNDHRLQLHNKVQPPLPHISTPLLQSYNLWFQHNNYQRNIISDDELRYSQISFNTESQWLYDTVPILCVVLTSTDKYTSAVNFTWGTSCNRIIFYNNTIGHDRQKPNSFKVKAKSSFHVLCDVIRDIHKYHSDIEWSIFVKDDMFVIPENLRYLVAPLNASDSYYLGHPINFWGVDYNIAMAGYVLSRGAIKKLSSKFPDAKSCISGGKYWKQEDLYLGKHLRSMNVHPVDIRDDLGNTLFLGYDLDKMMFPNSIHEFANYYTRALYPVKCCGKRVITFQVLSSTETYRYYYMIYTMRIFLEGSFGNQPAPTPMPDDQVWKDFLRKKGLPLNISAKEYETSWYTNFYNITEFKHIFEKHLRSKKKSSDKYLNLTSMSEVLADILLNYSPKRL